MASVRGDLDSALVRYNDSLSAFERADDEQGMCWVLNNLGLLHTTLNHREEAEDSLGTGAGARAPTLRPPDGIASCS